jgi:hypothetical protein
MSTKLSSMLKCWRKQGVTCLPFMEGRGSKKDGIRGLQTGAILKLSGIIVELIDGDLL